jgi:hypothetical protein
MSYEQGIASHACSRKRGLSAGVTAANHNDIEVL